MPRGCKKPRSSDILLVGTTLVERIPEAKFEALYREHRLRVLRYLLRRVDDPAAAEDLAAETFLVAWRRLGDVPADALPWLLGTARRLLANYRRSLSRRPPGRPLTPNLVERLVPEDLAERLSEKRAFAEAFGALSEEDREVLTLVAWDGLKPREAAAVLETTPALFSLRLHRARRRLMKKMDQAGHSIGTDRRQLASEGEAGDSSETP